MQKAALSTLFVAALSVVAWIAGGFQGVVHAQSDSTGTDPVEETLRRQNAKNDSLLDPETLDRDTTGLWNPFNLDNPDSLLEYLNRDRDDGLRFSVTPLSFSTYNRVEGQRVGVTFRLSDERWFDGEAAGGYAVKTHRWSGFGQVTLGEPNGPAARLEAHDRTMTFGPNRIDYAAGFLSLVAGQDRQDYLRSRGGSVRLWPFRNPGGHVWMAAGHREELPLEALADYHIFGGGTPMEGPNPLIDRGRTRSVSLGGTVFLRQRSVELTAEAGVAGGELGGDFTYPWQSGRAIVKPVFPDGGILTLSVEGTRVGAGAPVQALPYLGGDGNLRAYERLEFAGRSRLSGRAEYATGVDLLGRTGIGFLGKLRLQLIPFVDVGTTWGDSPGVYETGETLDGDLRSSFGLGFRREFWLPGIQAVRFDISRRTDGARDPWGFWFRILSLQ